MVASGAARVVVFPKITIILLVGVAAAGAPAGVNYPTRRSSAFDVLEDLSRSPGRTFDFWSGSAYDPAGRGAWWFVVDEAGCFAVGHDVAWDVSSYGPYYLTAAECDGLWELVEAVEPLAVAYPVRPGLPEELRYRFVVREDGEAVFSLWGYEPLADDTLRVVVDRLRETIEKYTGVTPALK